MSTCASIRKQIIRYIDREVEAPLRREIARHLDTCNECYDFYLHQFDLQQELKHGLPRIGQQQDAELGRVWSAVQTELASTGFAARSSSPHYGIAAFFVTLAMIIQLMLGGQQVSLAAPPTQPSPILLPATPQGLTPLAVGTAVALEPSQVELTTTPEPGQHTAVQTPPELINTP